MNEPDLNSAVQCFTKLALAVQKTRRSLKGLENGYFCKLNADNLGCMTEEIDLGGIKVPAEDWKATPESIKLVLMFLLEERKQMKEKIEELEERLNKNSRNSSIPASKNGFAAEVKSRLKPKKKKPLKMQAPRNRQNKELYSPEECVACHEEKPIEKSRGVSLWRGC